MKLKKRKNEKHTTVDAPVNREEEKVVSVPKTREINEGTNIVNSSNEEEREIDIYTYFVARRINPSHYSGMLAFTNIRKATKKKFDEIFKNY